MGILDDAIKEHLELKRQHGADASELQQLEDEAFGAAERPGDRESAPDPLAEAPTEFMSQPDLVQPAEPEADDEGAPEAAAPQAEAEEEASSRRSPRAEIADLQEAPQSESDQRVEEPEEPADEESPAMEHEAVPKLPPEPEASEPEPEMPAGPSIEEREVISEQPTEMFDVEEELAASEPQAPSEEELVEEEMSEPRLAPVDPLSSLDEDGAGEVDEETDDFFDEKRLSDELDQALEAPSEVDEELPESEVEPEEEPEAEEPPPARHDEDVLEETPDFLEEAPEDDQLWFEQKPPKDFDFDD
jgi:hypothetical protein